MMPLLRNLAMAAAAVPLAAAINLDPSSQDSLKQAAFVVSHGMTSYYSGNESGQAPGYLPGSGQKDGYYWWEGAGFFGSLIDYWYYTGDATFNDITMQALTWQMGADKNYEPANASQTLGNDDIGFWAMSALKAAELKFPNPPPSQGQWIPVVQRVFNDFVARWDTKTCNGGLHWQAFVLSQGYNLKNAVASGSFFSIAARLGKYSGNQTYFDWASKIYDWTEQVKLINPSEPYITDWADSDTNCTKLGGNPWTYNQGLYLYGAACMLNATGDPVWKQRVDMLLGQMQQSFFRNGVMLEIGCEETATCNNDQKSFKSYTLIWLAETAKVASYTAATIMPLLSTTAMAAAKACTGGSDGVTCGYSWMNGQYDGTKGIGQQMNALEAFNAMLTPYAAGPISNFKDGGLSNIAPDGGTSDPNARVLAPITAGDQAGAGIITFLLVVGTLGGAVWMLFDDLQGPLSSLFSRRAYRSV